MYQPDSFILCPKAEYSTIKTFKRKADEVVVKTLFQGHSYTPDWYVVFTKHFFKTFPNHRLKLQPAKGKAELITDFTNVDLACMLVDVKGGFNRHGGDRIFPIHQKLMWSIHKKLVNKIVPVDLFKQLGVVPDQLKWMKGRKVKTPKKAFMFVPTFEDLIQKQLLFNK